MADVAMWTDKKVKAEFEVKAKSLFEELQPELEELEGIVAIEPESGEYFVGATLGKADAAAYAQHPDTWVYFVRLDNPEAAIALPTW
jgi:hypothetical protein